MKISVHKTYIFGNVIQFPTFHIFYSKQDILCNYLKNPSKLRDAYFFSFLLHLTRQKWHSLACNHPITFFGYIKKNYTETKVVYEWKSYLYFVSLPPNKIPTLQHTSFSFSFCTATPRVFLFTWVRYKDECKTIINLSANLYVMLTVY